MANQQKVVYIVDDETMITNPLQRLFNRMLKKRDIDRFQLETANDPTQALAHIQALHEDGKDLALVIADIMMPQMNGLDFLQEVKSLFPLAPRIVLTGYADKENAIRALNELDLYYYVEKPWENDVFTELFLRALQKHRQDKVEAMFRLYVPYEVIEEFIDRSDQTFLEGKDLDATVMFLDIADFTAQSEKMAARSVVTLLNQYFTLMVDVIHEHNGILDKYTGDGLMALFGVPVSSGATPVDAQNGVKAALAIADRIQELSDSNGETAPPIRIRMGLNTGKMVVGNIGSRRRVNYTAVSDVVNTASRIEDAARYVIGDDPACILISQSTHDYVKEDLQGQVIFEDLGPVDLRGKSEKQQLYRVIPTGL